MVKKIFLLAVMACLVACEEKYSVPENLVSEEKMVQVLIDMRIAEGKVVGLTIPTDSAKNLYKYLEQKIFIEHDVDSSAYLASYEYYMLDAEQFMRITDTVIDSLKVRLKQVTTNNN